MFILTVVNLLQSDVVKGTPNANCDINAYLGAIFNQVIIIAAVLAVLVIGYSGLQYMFSNVPGLKSESKGRIWSAVGGLILVLAAFLILKEINPQITSTLQQNFNSVLKQPPTPCP